MAEPVEYQNPTTWKEAALMILQERRCPMEVWEIAEAIMERQLPIAEGKSMADIRARIATQIVINIQKHPQDTPFKKVGWGCYALREGPNDGEEKYIRWKDAIAMILEDKACAMRPSEIASEMQRRGWAVSNPEGMANRICNVLSKEIRKDASVRIIDKIGDGLYILSQFNSNEDAPDDYDRDEERYSKPRARRAPAKTAATKRGRGRASRAEPAPPADEYQDVSHAYHHAHPDTYHAEGIDYTAGYDQTAAAYDPSTGLVYDQYDQSGLTYDAQPTYADTSAGHAHAAASTTSYVDPTSGMVYNYEYYDQTSADQFYDDGQLANPEDDDYQGGSTKRAKRAKR